MDTYFKRTKQIQNMELDMFTRTKAISLDEMELYNSTVGHETNCSKCKGRGYIAEVLGEKDVRGNTVRCYMVLKECECLSHKKENIVANNSGIQPLLQKTFDNFIANSSWQANVKKLAEENARSNDWFYIGGQSGAGKTHICSAITNYQSKNGKKVKYMTWNEQINELKNFEDNSVIEKLKRVECLYIDDLFKRPKGEDGLPKLSSPDIDKTWELINFRYLNKLKTIISSEVTLEDLIRIDESLGSRIKQCADKYIVSIKGNGRNLRLN